MKKLLIPAVAALAVLTPTMASAQEDSVPDPVTVDDDSDDDGNAGLWGLVGLLGLAGLAGLRRRPEHRTVVATRTRAGGVIPEPPVTDP